MYNKVTKGGKSAFDHGALARVDPSDPRNTAVSVGKQKVSKIRTLFCIEYNLFILRYL